MGKGVRGLFTPFDRPHPHTEDATFTPLILRQKMVPPLNPLWTCTDLRPGSCVFCIGSCVFCVQRPQVRIIFYVQEVAYSASRKLHILHILRPTSASMQRILHPGSCVFCIFCVQHPQVHSVFCVQDTKYATYAASWTQNMYAERKSVQGSQRVNPLRTSGGVATISLRPAASWGQTLSVPSRNFGLRHGGYNNFWPGFQSEEGPFFDVNKRRNAEQNTELQILSYGPFMAKTFRCFCNHYCDLFSNLSLCLLSFLLRSASVRVICHVRSAFIPDTLWCKWS